MAKFFEKYPVTTYKFKEGDSISDVNMKDITIKFKLPKFFKEDNFINNSNASYRFNMEDGLRLDLLSNIYYKDSYKYWSIMLMNDMFNIHEATPIQTSTFDSYLFKKYREHAITSVNPRTDTLYPDSEAGVLAYTRDTVAFYTDEEGYNIGFKQYNPGLGHTFTTLYDKEFNENESKRTITMLSINHIQELEEALSDNLKLLSGD